MSSEAERLLTEINKIGKEIKERLEGREDPKMREIAKKVEKKIEEFTKKVEGKE